MLKLLLVNVIISLLHVEGDMALSRSELRQVTRFVQHRLSALDIQATFKYRRERNETTHHLESLSQRLERFNYYKQARKNAGHKKKRIYVAILPPSFDGPDSYIWGYSSGIFCSKNDLFFVGTGLSAFNTRGELRLKHSGYVLLHELAHVLGAGHINTKTVMNPDATRLVQELGDLKFDEFSKMDIKECLEQ